MKSPTTHNVDEMTSHNFAFFVFLPLYIFVSFLVRSCHNLGLLCCGSFKNKLAKARKMRKPPGTLVLKKFRPGKFGIGKVWAQHIEKVEDKLRKLGQKSFLGQKKLRSKIFFYQFSCYNR